MHGLLPAQRATTLTLGHHHASASGQCGAAQPPAPAGAGSVSAESSQPSGRLGLAGQSPRGGGESFLRHAHTGTAEAVSPATSGVGQAGDRLQGTGVGYRLRVTGNREPLPVPRNLSPITSGMSPRTFGALPRLLALGLIRFYQACLSPVMPSACRFYPSCSAYAFEAVEKWGVWRGGRLALGRLLRCRPWSSSYGYDPVPEK